MPAWLLLAAFAVHNTEEALTAPRYFDRMRGELPIPWPSAGAFQLATVTVTFVALLATAIAVRRQHTAYVTALAWIMLANTVVPHVPLAILSGGYAPGLITALLLNLPAGLLWLRLRRDLDRTNQRDGHGPGLTRTAGAAGAPAPSPARQEAAGPEDARRDRRPPAH
ncbi:hypothetical protein GCM10010123_19320 [Pilimelia anulata]|uniref:HXXEE domain-containing protein n=1 Tax=Pilimelia anulata TaxID=53371 RepID=A0A8J3B9I3_9ACTN|nr:HXXEE domain-containing protein [Pilimelia anulata]GGJ89680.1 hypothetical protein GCM10010123_19320 [Pilimelia anulata]